MPGKQAKVLTPDHVEALLKRASEGRYPIRDRVIVLLSVNAGLRAGEIANLTWSMILDADGKISDRIELHDAAAKKRSGRTIPLHRSLRRELARLKLAGGGDQYVVQSERGDGRMNPGSIVNWFAGLYRELGLAGCSSHSGRRTFITKAARLVFRAGGSLRDVQQLAGHKSINQTQVYIDGDAQAKKQLVAMM